MNSRGLAFSAKLCGRLDTRLKWGDVPGVQCNFNKFITFIMLSVAC